MLMAIATLTLLASVVAHAQHQDRTPDPQHQAARQQLHQTLSDWARTTIFPTLTGWKNQLDGAMSPEDLSTLNALRARATTLRKEAITHWGGLREAWQSEDYAALKHHRDALKGMREQRKALLAELKPLAMKYQQTLQQIGEKAKPQMEQWRQEKRKKVEEWKAANEAQLGNGPFGIHGRAWKGGWGKMFGFGGKMQKKAAVARFMLWDGGDFTQDIRNMAPAELHNEGFELK